ncbi:MAG: glycosyltransferase family 2 protein [Blautia sp.]|nr:glycosyltransferase family 2 protein [Blautia sp.]
MSSKVIFSVVIPAYNVEKLITKALESVRKQTYQNYEIVVVNDGSKDDTEKVVGNYSESHPDMKIIYERQKNGGAAVARSRGIELSTGDYIAFLDADDIWYPQKLESVLKCINEDKGDFYYNGEMEIGIDGSKRESNYRQLNEDALSDMIINGNPISTSTVVVRADLLKKYQTFNDGIRYAEDFSCWISLARAGLRFYYIPEILGEYIRNENGLTLRSSEYTEKSGERILDFFDFLDQSKYSEDQINEMKRIRRSENKYNIARLYHKKGIFQQATKYYREALKINRGNKRAFVGVVLASIHIKK